LPQKLIKDWDVWKHLQRPFRRSSYLLPNWREVIQQYPARVQRHPLRLAAALLQMALRDLLTAFGFLIGGILLLCFAPGLLITAIVMWIFSSAQVFWCMAFCTGLLVLLINVIPVATIFSGIGTVIATTAGMLLIGLIFSSVKVFLAAAAILLLILLGFNGPSTTPEDGRHSAGEQTMQGIP
jgi:hypothetical protein